MLNQTAPPSELQEFLRNVSIPCPKDEGRGSPPNRESKLSLAQATAYRKIAPARELKAAHLKILQTNSKNGVRSRNPPSHHPAECSLGTRNGFVEYQSCPVIFKSLTQHYLQSNGQRQVKKTERINTLGAPIRHLALIFSMRDSEFHVNQKEASSVYAAPTLTG